MRLELWMCAIGLGCSSNKVDGEYTGGDGSDTATETGDAPLPSATDRRVLHEVFTGSNCGPCLGADAILDDVFHETSRSYSVIKYQVGSDPYMSSEGVRRRMYYLPGEDVYAIPYVHADGLNGFHPAELNDDAGYGLADLDAMADIPAVVELTVSHTISDQTVDSVVSWTALDTVESDSLVIHAAIIENKTFGNVGSNGQTEFHQVMKKMVPDENGTPISSLVRGDEGSLSLSWTFNGDYDDDTSISNQVDHATAHTVEEFEDLEVVVFLQDAVSWEVHQSAWTID